MRTALVVLLLLAGCNGGPAPAITVKEAVFVPCDVPLPKRPIFADETLTGDEDIWTIGRALWSGRLARSAYERELEIALEGCTKK